MGKSKNTPTASELIRRLDRAFEKRSAGNQSDALHEFEGLERLSTHSKDISALRLFQTYCLMDMARSDDALHRISQVNAEDLELPLRANYEYQFARILHAHARVKDAISHAERAREIFASLSDDLVDKSIAACAETLMGLLLAESGRCVDARDILQKVTAHDPDWGYARLRLGDCHMNMRQFDEAVECFLTVVSSDLKIDPTVRTDAIRNAGCSYYWLGEYGKCVEYLLRVKDAYRAYPELEDTVITFLNTAESHLKKPH
jgi:tetratricopeptide (TPR) repeat protein